MEWWGSGGRNGVLVLQKWRFAFQKVFTGVRWAHRWSCSKNVRSFQLWTLRRNSGKKERYPYHDTLLKYSAAGAIPGTFIAGWGQGHLSLAGVAVGWDWGWAGPWRRKAPARERGDFQSGKNVSEESGLKGRAYSGKSQECPPGWSVECLGLEKEMILESGLRPVLRA